MFINLFLAAVLSSSGVEPAANRPLPTDVSSKIGLYLLVSTACDQMVGTNAGPTAKETSGLILRGYGFSDAEVEVMMKHFVRENLDLYINSIKEASDNSETAIRYFCLSTIEQKQNAVEEIGRYNRP